MTVQCQGITGRALGLQFDKKKKEGTKLEAGDQLGGCSDHPDDISSGSSSGDRDKWIDFRCLGVRAW